LSKNIAFAEMIGRVNSSSKRLSEKGVLGFAWQNGYGAFSVSESSVEAVTAYISDQAEHHRKFSYQEELREFLERHRVPGLKPWVVSCTSFGRLEYAQENVQTAERPGGTPEHGRAINPKDIVLPFSKGVVDLYQGAIASSSKGDACSAASADTES
jgi:hypothetical protein